MYAGVPSTKSGFSSLDAFAGDRGEPEVDELDVESVVPTTTSAFDGVTSAWITPRSCAAASACAICARDRDDLGRMERAARDAIGEALALEQLHHEVRTAIGEVAEVEHVDDVRMTHARRRARLAQEPLRGRGVAARRPCERSTLSAYVPAEHGVLDAKHRAHAAFAEGLDHPVVTDHVADAAGRDRAIATVVARCLRDDHQIGAQTRRPGEP